MGTISLREAAHAVESTRRVLRSLPPAERPIQLGALSAFASRCHWHCHFIQKLENEPDIETRNFHRGFDGLRDDGPDDNVLESYLHGRTGFPFVDACMRSLRATGWINFRMRAMLTSFAAYHLWIDWRRIRDPLARMFIDYEPGIHFSQLQMQSGVTGINTLRIYNPVKQGLDHDPEGEFTRRWVPELRDAPAGEIHEPWKHGRPYLPRLTDEKEAVRQARARFAEVRRADGFRAENQRVYEKHGSRKGGTRERRLNGADATEFENRKKTGGAQRRSSEDPRQQTLVFS